LAKNRFTDNIVWKGAGIVVVVVVVVVVVMLTFSAYVAGF
jgi:uncharacterized membrane protein